MPSVTASRFSIDAIRLIGGRPCLDFVNSVHDRFAAVPEDYLAAPEHYLGWCLRAGLLSQTEADHLPVAAILMAEVWTFREHLHALLSARIDGAAVPADSLRECDRWLHLAWSSLVLDPASSEGVSWLPATVDATLPLKRIALSALDLLRAAPHRLKRCASTDSCGWLFYDDSKGGQRRWCAMETCGTVQKMRRYRSMEPEGMAGRR